MTHASPTQSVRQRKRWIAVAAAALLFGAVPARADDGSRVDTVPAASGTEGRTVTLPLPRAGYIVWTHIAARSRPRASAPIVVKLPQFRHDFRRQVVLALARHTEPSGKQWYKVVIPGR